MKSYSVIPHTADVRLKVEADSFSELFVAALEGMNNIILPNYKNHLNKRALVKKISLSSFDKTSFLIDFLSEVLTLSHVYRAIFYDVHFTKFETNSLKGELIGTQVDKFREDIKAVTHHEAEVKKTNKKYETTIVFDI